MVGSDEGAVNVLRGRRVKVLGLISGTSADGIDAALVDVRGERFPYALHLLAFRTYPFPRGMGERIRAAAHPGSGSVDEICRLNFALGELFARAAIALARGARVPLERISLIGSHGQTLQHRPRPERVGGLRVRSTLQIGEPCVIAERTGVTTVADFRTRDVAAGGEGAPLTPLLHWVLFHRGDRTRAVQNVGGISNITVLPAGRPPSAVTAFDTGPGNMVIDAVVRRLTDGRDGMDRGGRMAGRGRVHRGLLGRLLSAPYFSRRPPKSTGREAYGEPYVDRVFARARRLRLAPDDLVATVTALTAESIADQIRRYVLPRHGDLREIIVGGGGARNPVLLDLLARALPSLEVSPYESHGFDSRAIEAMAFALLARMTVAGRGGNLPRATGARRPAVLGKIVPGRRP